VGHWGDRGGRRRTAGHRRERRQVAEILAAQQRGRGAEEAEAAANRLTDDRSVAVVTGQQAVLFGGPLYVLYKALAAMRVARDLERQRGVPAVPVFWVASDDHDFAEIRSTTVLDEAGRLHTFRLNPQRERSASPPGGSSSTTASPGSSRKRRLGFRQARSVKPSWRDCATAYAPGESLSGAFARFLSALLPGFVVLDPADPS